MLWRRCALSAINLLSAGAGIDAAVVPAQKRGGIDYYVYYYYQ